MEFNSEIKKATDPIYKKISKTIIIVSENQEQNISYLEKIGIEDNSEVESGTSFSNLIFQMEPDPVALRQVDVTAHEIDKNISDILKQAIFGPSKIRESYMTAGASVDAVSIKDIKMSPSLNFYEGLDDIKEVVDAHLSLPDISYLNEIHAMPVAPNKKPIIDRNKKVKKPVAIRNPQ